jgi:hypothetical protein
LDDVLRAEYQVGQPSVQPALLELVAPHPVLFVCQSGLSDLCFEQSAIDLIVIWDRDHNAGNFRVGQDEVISASAQDPAE